jgi:type 1 fimbria pilin
MARPLGTRISGCVLIALAMLASMPSANAATGRIVFSGAVVEPTCSTERVQADATNRLPPINDLAPTRQNCGRTSSDPGRSYARTVVSLDAATIANDRLLDYFAGYANAEAADGERAKLIIRTYD